MKALDAGWFSRTSVRRMYVCNAGYFDYDMGHMTFGYNMGTPLTVITVFLVLETDSGYVVFDTGWSPNMVPVLESIGLNPRIGPENDVGRYLEELGIGAGEVRMAVLSHLHLDHAGGLARFKGCRVVVQRDELNHARGPHPFAAIPYTRLDWDFPDFEWEAVDGDVMLDKGLALVLLNGHTPGTSGLLVNLPNRGPLLFTGDNCYLRVNLENDLIPGSIWEPRQAWHSLRKAKFLAELTGASLVPSHDREVYGEKLPLFPECLD